MNDTKTDTKREDIEAAAAAFLRDAVEHVAHTVNANRDAIETAKIAAEREDDADTYGALGDILTALDAWTAASAAYVGTIRGHR